MIDLDAIWRTDVVRRPFECFVAPDVLRPETLHAVRADFPEIDRPGLFPLRELDYGPAFRRLIEDLQGQAFRYLIGKKFGLNLSLRPLMITVRGHAHRKDGQVHTDARHKVITCLLYLNDRWQEPGGRLRLLRSAYGLSDGFAEIPPHGGTLVALRRSGNSWHGHAAYEGPRRCLVLNWMRSPAARSREIARHRLSAKVERLDLGGGLALAA